MKANYEGERGVRVIRPLVYVRESATKAFAQESRLPIINENCPACFEQPKERARVKKMLAKEESLYPLMYTHLKRGLVPLMGDRVYDIMKVRPLPHPLACLLDPPCASWPHSLTHSHPPSSVGLPVHRAGDAGGDHQPCPREGLSEGPWRSALSPAGAAAAARPGRQGLTTATRARPQAAATSARRPSHARRRRRA